MKFKDEKKEEENKDSIWAKEEMFLLQKRIKKPSRDKEKMG